MKRLLYILSVLSVIITFTLVISQQTFAQEEAPDNNIFTEKPFEENTFEDEILPGPGAPPPPPDDPGDPINTPVSSSLLELLGVFSLGVLYLYFKRKHIKN